MLESKLRKLIPCVCIPFLSKTKMYLHLDYLLLIYIRILGAKILNYFTIFQNNLYMDCLTSLIYELFPYLLLTLLTLRSIIKGPRVMSKDI